MHKLIFTWIFVLASISSTRSDYIAAVLEYSSITSSTPNATVEENLKEYIRYIELAAINSASIIVFPEYGLTGLYSDPSPYGIVIPNINEGPSFQDYWLEKLSNAASANGIYVVVNLVEKDKNDKNETVYYNTNVMFDKYGKIGAKYRQINVYAQPLLTPGNPVQNQAVFSTEFGVTFGMVICYDMFFHNPSRSILTNSSVTDVILSSSWYATLPFYHSLSYHLGYAQANKVNLLVSNLNYLSKGISGSGIYGGNGTVFSYYLPGTPTSKMLISTVKNTPINDFVPYGFNLDTNEANEAVLANFPTNRVFDSNRYKFQMLNLSTNSTNQKKICHDSFCCQFNITMGAQVNTSEVYQLMAYTGSLRLMNETLPSVRICTLLACDSSDPSSCGTRSAGSSTKFLNITVTSEVLVGRNDFFQPLFLTTDLLPVYNTSYESRTASGRTYLSLGTTKEEGRVLAFGIYGSGGAAMNFSCFVVAAMVIMSCLFQ